MTNKNLGPDTLAKLLVPDPEGEPELLSDTDQAAFAAEVVALEAEQAGWHSEEYVSPDGERKSTR